MTKEFNLSEKVNLAHVIPEEDVKEKIQNAQKRLKEELNTLLINSNKVCGQALLNKKVEGYSEEHIFDNFFKRMQFGMKERTNKIFKEEFGEKLI